MNEKNESSETDDTTSTDTSSTPSALSVEWNLPYLGSVADSASVKCTTCEAVTIHQHATIQPKYVGMFEGDPEKVVETALKNTKRIFICTHCGKLSLKG